ncbi:MAG: chitobiase/beta-hexosaminidase C-terminal domain-containing protein [Methanocorpusculum sp.]|nr:chitobiase/beta-hexosaminidase C-terminal domain-containing protein [Methanocorpusculum sp.]
MKQKLILIITLLLALACAAVPAVADSSSSAPLLPMQFFGTASYENGDAVPAGFSIVAELGGQTFTHTLTEDGIFGSDGVWGEKFLVDGDTAGEIITFSLVDTAGDSVSAAETVTYNPGEISEIALTFESQSDDTPKHSAWLSTDNVSVGDVFYLNISGNAEETVFVIVDTYRVSIHPDLDNVDYTISSNAYNITLDATGNCSVPFTAERIGDAQFDIGFSDNSGISVSVNITAAKEGYLKIQAPAGLSLDAGDKWVYAHYYNEFGKWQGDVYVTWKIDDKSVIGLAEMEDRSVRLSPRSIGTAVLYAELSDNPLINATVELVVEETEIVGITGGCSSSTLSLGTTGSAWANAVDQFGKEFSYNEIEWSVSGGNISLTSSEDDKHKVTITPIAVGTETITALSLSTGLTWNLTVTVVAGTTNPDAGDPYEVVYGPGDLYLSVDAVPHAASAYVLDIFGNVLYNEEIEWVIDNESVAVVSVETDINDNTHEIKVTPKANGTTVLHAYAKSNPLLNESAVIHVEDTIISSVSGPYIPEKITIGGMNWWSSVYVCDQFGYPVPGEKATVTVNNSSVLILYSDNGSGSSVQLTNGETMSYGGLSQGVVTVKTVAVSNLSASLSQTVTVENSIVALISLQNHADSILPMRSNHYFHAEVVDQYGDYLYSQELVWTVGNEGVVSITDTWDYSVELCPIAPGTTTIRAALKSDRTIYDEITVTVEETILRSIYLSGTTEMSLFAQGDAYAVAKDQYGNDLPEEEIGWKVDNPAILEISDGWSSGNHWVDLYPKALGSTKIHAYAVSDPSITWNMTVSVVKPVLTKIELPYSTKTVSMNTLASISADVWDQFDNHPDYAEIYWTVDNESVLELSSTLSKNGREILLIPQMPGVVNLTVSPVGFPEYSETVQIIVSGSALPTVTTDFPVTAYNGETLKISGTAEDGMVLQAIIFGKDGVWKHTASANADGEFTFTIPTANLSTGSYSLVLQSPMYDGYFNIDAAADGKVYLNTTGPAVVDGVGCGTVLFKPADRNPANAAQAFYDAVFASGVDDWCAIGAFTVEDSSLVMNDVEDIVVGAPLEVSGTSSYPAGTKIFIELSDYWSGELVLNETATVSASGTWNATFNTTGLATGNYQVYAELPGVSSWSSSVYLYEGIQLYLYGPTYVELDSADEYLSVGYWANIPVSDDGLDCIWNVSNESVLTIIDTDSWGLKEIRPAAEGTTTIRVSLVDDPSVFAETEVTVVSEFIPTSLSIWLYDDTISTAASGIFSVDIFDQFGQSLYSKNGESLSTLINVTSDNTSVVTVAPSSESGNYLLIPVAPGTAEIRAVLSTDDSLSAAATVTVVASEMGIYLWADSETISVGTESYIQAYVYDQFEHPAAMYTDEFIWSVSNPDILQLAADYDERYSSNYRMKMTALAPGTATVTAVWKENPFYVAEYTVTVEKPVHNYISTEVWGQITLDAVVGAENGYIEGVLCDQHGNIILTNPVSATIVNKSVISLTKDSENTARWIIQPLAVGTTDVVLSVKDSSVEPSIVSVTVEDTKPRLSIDTLGSLYSNEISLSYADLLYFGAVDQFGNFLNPEKYPVSWNVSDTTVLNVTTVTQETEVYDVLVVKPNTTGTAVLTFSLENGVSKSVELTVSEETEIIYVGIGDISAYETDAAPAAPLQTASLNTPYPPYPEHSDVQRLTLGTDYAAVILAADQFGNIFGTDALAITVDNPGIISWEWQQELASYGIPGWMLNITPLKAGTVTLTAASADDPSVFDSVTVTVVGPTLIVPSGQAEIIVPPTISPKGGMLYQDIEVTITTETVGASVYYTLDGTTPTNQSILYEKPFVLDESAFANGKSLIIKAVAVKDGCADSTVVTEIYTHAKKDKPKHKVQAASVTGGSVTISSSESEADELITLTFTENEGYKLAGWSIQGSISGTYSNKSGTVSDFAMWDEDVIIVPDFIQIVDQTPKPTAIKFQHVPSKIYENDTGAFNAIVYDQFGNRLANNAVTWNSSAPSVFAIDKDTGVYQAKAGGIAVVTAASITNPDVSASVTLSVYVPPKPLITGEISGPVTAYYGVMSDPYIVTSEYSSHLNWDFGDGTPTVKTEVNYPYPYHTSSYDTVSHTFVETGDLTVELTPSNSYREGETKTFNVHVTYAPPRNLVITDGPTAVVGGKSYVYTAFATGADTYTWYLDGQVVEGETGSSATITFPTSQNERTAEVKVAASYKDSGNCDPVTKTVTVSVEDGVLGAFGDDITMNPAKPAVGDVVVFSIEKVSNAVKYLWTFEDGHTETTTAPKVSHALKDTTTDSVTVTAYNSAGLTKEKTYTFTVAGAKPAKPAISASKTPANPGDTIIFTAESSGATTYKWTVDGSVQESTANTCEVFWTVDDVGKHEVAVTVSNDYGTAKNSIVYEVAAKKGKPAFIKKITGPDVMNEQGSETFNAVIQCQDDYDIAWYLNNELIEGETTKHLKLQLPVGEYVLKVVVTTEYEEVSEYEKYFKVVSKKDKQKNNKDKNLATPENAVTPQLVDNSSSGKSAFSTVGSLKLDKDDISKDADEVSIEIAPINPEELAGFTDEMGSRQNVLMSLEINPTGLKNEKSLEKSAHITFRLLKDDVADSEAVQFYRLDTGSGVDQWVRLHKVSCVEDGDYYEFTVATAGMSQFVAAPVSLLDEQEKPAVPTVEITNTTATFNAKIPAEVSYTLSPDSISSLRAPVLTKGGLTLTIGDVIVEKVVGGTSTKVSSEVLENGEVSVSGDISDAESLKVSFMGRILGDTLGNGKVGAVSALKIAQNIVGLESGKMSDTDKFYGDVNGDGNVKVVDALMIAQYTVGILDENYVRVA